MKNINSMILDGAGVLFKSWTVFKPIWDAITVDTGEGRQKTAKKCQRHFSTSNPFLTASYSCRGPRNYFCGDDSNKNLKIAQNASNCVKI